VASPDAVPNPGRPAGGVGAALSRGLSVAKVLEIDALHGSTVLAGHAGLDRTVRRLNVMEVPDILPWVKPGELMLTTGYPLRHDPDALAHLVCALDAIGLAALGVKLNRYLDEIPAPALAEADRLGLPMIRLPDHVAFDDILEQVLTDLLDRQAAALTRSEEVHRALLQIVLDGGGLPEVAAGLAGVLGGAVVLTTPDGRVLADAGDPKALAAAYGSSCFDPNGRLRVDTEAAGLCGHSGLAGNHVVVPVVAARVDHGRIIAFSPTGQLSEEDVPTLERAATVSALALTKQLAVRAVESKYAGDFLRDVLSGRVGPEAAVTHAASLGWNIDRPMVVVVTELDPEPEQDPGPAHRPALERFAAAWQAAVRPRDPNAPVAGFHREVVALLGIPARGDVDRYVRELLVQVAGAGGGRRSFSTGISRSAPTAAELPAAYEQARTALRVGRRRQGCGAVAHFESLGVFRLLSLIEDHAQVQDFAEETLGELARRDDPETLDLRRTLEVLLDTNLNVAEAARVLHYHYNTLRYRIAKLERMLGPFTTDPQLRLSLHVALQVLRMRGS